MTEAQLENLMSELRRLNRNIEKIGELVERALTPVATVPELSEFWPFRSDR